jgi:hypothetical protein
MSKILTNKTNKSIYKKAIREVPCSVIITEPYMNLPITPFGRELHFVPVHMALRKEDTTEENHYPNG